ncbi:hypothetical protein GCM10028774_51820 [Spirosoma jeollabukense]
MEQREKLVRKRVVISGPAIEARKRDTDNVIAILTKELKDSAYIDPLGQPEPSTSPIDLKKEITCSEAIDYYLDTVSRSLSKGSRRTYKTCGNAFQN